MTSISQVGESNVIDLTTRLPPNPCPYCGRDLRDSGDELTQCYHVLVCYPIPPEAP